MRHLFGELVHNVDDDSLWNEYELAKLTLNELQSLAILFACAKTGTKEELVTKVLAIRLIRIRVAPYESSRDGARELTTKFDGRALRQMCKEANLWRSGNKIQLAIGLINWRDRCRREGQKALAAAQQSAASKPRQLTLQLT
ncbi:MAG: hypothetical protein QOE70_4736 [Chthoniobacter sp.]|jgi:hypothetical protein|nr:hypothetical protein [Chthoniobacter sp.]